MGLWASYFFAKCFLYVWGAIPLDAPANLLFAVWLLLPTPARLARFRSVAAIRTVVTVIAALLLLWHDSWLPPLTVAAAFVRDGGLRPRDSSFNSLRARWSRGWSGDWPCSWRRAP